ncbi:MAG: AAA family ATPase, partial [Prevotellaceae bacterium]|nr:AAA family ATPase [Prevotellaceae bacterium]
MLQKLPVGIQSFADLRNKDYLYVDKTEHIYRMIVRGKPYFLSR